jgi:hypothetical protein
MKEGAPGQYDTGRNGKDGGKEVSPLLMRNKLQIEIAALDLGFKPTDDQLGDWIKEHGRHFGNLVDGNPDILRRYADRQLTLEDIQQALHDAEAKKPR